MANNKVHNGDKFVIEVGSTYYSPTMGNRYFIKGFDSLVMTDIGISRLQKYEDPKEVLHTCENCKHKYESRADYPCSVCENNYDINTVDMFEPKNGK